MLKLTKDKIDIYLFYQSNIEICGCIAIDKVDSSFKTNIGGTRMAEYESIDHTVEDAILLSKAMSKKCMIADLPHRGAKGIIMKKKCCITNKNIFFKEYGKIINRLNGKFITGCDIGIYNSDIEIVKTISPFVTALNIHNFDYLSFFSALSIFESMKLYYNKYYSITNLYNSTVLIIGVGKVGYSLAQILVEKGIKVIVNDINEKAILKIKKNLNCQVVGNDDINSISYDILAPCAFGNYVNNKNVYHLNCKLICGAANNQIHNLNILDILDQRKIQYIPDFISNIGGAIYASLSYNNKNLSYIENYIKNIIHTKLSIYLDKSHLFGSKQSLYHLLSK